MRPLRLWRDYWADRARFAIKGTICFDLEHDEGRLYRLAGVDAVRPKCWSDRVGVVVGHELAVDPTE